MQHREFDEFVRRQQEGASQIAAMNWEKERVEWLRYLDDLYSCIESFLEKYISSGQIRKEYKAVELNEEYVGLYKVKQMVLRIGPQEVNVVPIGTVLIGSKGRVDLIGPTGRVQLLLLDSRVTEPGDLIRAEVSIGGERPAQTKKPLEKITWEWKIMARPPARRFMKLNQENFFQVLMEIANG